MAVFIEDLTAVQPTVHWTLLLAQQPDPDLEFAEEELDRSEERRVGKECA